MLSSIINKILRYSTIESHQNSQPLTLVDVFELQNNSETMNYKIIRKTRTSTRDSMGLDGIRWDYMGLGGIAWDYMGLHGIT